MQMVLPGIECNGIKWIYLAQDRVIWQILMQTVMKIQVTYKMEIEQLHNCQIFKKYPTTCSQLKQAGTKVTQLTCIMIT